MSPVLGALQVDCCILPHTSVCAAFSTSGLFQVALLALDVGQLALQVLSQVSAVLDIQERRIAPRVQPKNSIEPVAPETPQLLPAVHVFWSTLAASLKVRGSLPRFTLLRRGRVMWSM